MSEPADSQVVLRAIQDATAQLQGLAAAPPGLEAAAAIAARLAKLAGQATASLAFEAEPPDFAREHDRAAAEDGR
jgi:hypothetical protein